MTAAPLSGSLGVARARRLLPALLATRLGLAGLAAACGDAGSPVDLGPGWLVPCATWFWRGRFTVQRYAFDPSGALVGAIALGQGPTTLPCNTAWVAAGPARAAEPQQSCSCAGSIDVAQCGVEPWFPWPL